MKPRSFTEEEVRAKFLNQVRAMAEYWANLPDKTPSERCDGLAFSILAMIDGANLDLPAFDLIPSPHPDDKEYCASHGQNWFEPGMVINDCQLHEIYYSEPNPKK